MKIFPDWHIFELCGAKTIWLWVAYNSLNVVWNRLKPLKGFRLTSVSIYEIFVQYDAISG